MQNEEASSPFAFFLPPVQHAHPLSQQKLYSLAPERRGSVPNIQHPEMKKMLILCYAARCKCDVE